MYVPPFGVPLKATALSARTVPVLILPVPWVNVPDTIKVSPDAMVKPSLEPSLDTVKLLNVGLEATSILMPFAPVNATVPELWVKVPDV